MQLLSSLTKFLLSILDFIFSLIKSVFSFKKNKSGIILTLICAFSLGGLLIFTINGVDSSNEIYFISIMFSVTFPMGLIGAFLSINVFGKEGLSLLSNLEHNETNPNSEIPFIALLIESALALKWLVLTLIELTFSFLETISSYKKNGFGLSLFAISYLSLGAAFFYGNINSVNYTTDFENIFIIGIPVTWLTLGLLISLYTFIKKRNPIKSDDIPQADFGTRKKPKKVLKNAPLSIFISYRRSDTEYVTGRIYDSLSQAFKKEKVFKDIDNIPLGVDFRHHLDMAISQCDFVIVIIGNQWLTVDNEDGTKRLFAPKDFVRIEIEAALKRSISVIPVLVGRSKMPAENDLPDSIKSLAYRNAISIRPDPDFHRDMNKLISGIRKDSNVN